MLQCGCCEEQPRDKLRRERLLCGYVFREELRDRSRSVCGRVWSERVFEKKCCPRICVARGGDEEHGRVTEGCLQAGVAMLFPSDPSEDRIARNIYGFLIGLTRSAALKLVSDTPDANGAEALRQFNVRYGNRDGQSETAVFQRLLSFSFGSKLEDVEERITDFLVLSQELESMAGGLDDRVKKHASASAAQSPTCTCADNH